MMVVRPRFVLFAGLLVATCWLGYWIGYITSRPPGGEHMSQVRAQTSDKHHIIEEHAHIVEEHAHIVEEHAHVVEEHVHPAHVEDHSDTVVIDRSVPAKPKHVMNRFDMLGIHRPHDSGMADHSHHDGEKHEDTHGEHHHHHHNADDMFLNKMIEVSSKLKQADGSKEQRPPGGDIQPTEGRIMVSRTLDDTSLGGPTAHAIGGPQQILPSGSQIANSPTLVASSNTGHAKGDKADDTAQGNVIGKSGIDAVKLRDTSLPGTVANKNNVAASLPKENVAEVKNGPYRPLPTAPGIGVSKTMQSGGEIQLPAQAVPKLPASWAAPKQPTSWDPEYYALVHGSKSSRVHGKLHEKMKLFDDSVPKEAYSFTSRSLPSDPRLRPSIANGHLGTAIHSGQVFMNGLYSGRLNESHRAIIPSTCSFNITETEPPSNFSRTYTLNVAEGMYSETSVSANYTLVQRIYAHRKYRQLLVAEVDLVRTEVKSPLKLKVALNRWKRSYDITFLTKDSTIDEVSYKWGTVNAGETATSRQPEVHMYYDHVPDELVPPPGAPRTKWVFLTAIAHTQQAALQAYQNGVQLVMSNDQLYVDHIEEWTKVWQGGHINVAGNMKLAQALYGSLYYILSSLPLDTDPQWPYVGLSPTGLPFGDEDHADLDYQGHVFWDQETWMFPPVLMFHPNLAKILTDTRSRTMEAAAENAQLNGRKGLMYPWESAFTGVEVCRSANISQQEVHVSGDISYAIMQYLYATGDISVLTTGTYSSILSGIADHWVSRLVYNETLDKYTILNVMGPDEHHGGVNNSAYTNAIAKIALEAPSNSMRLLGHKVDRWQPFSQEIYHPYDTVHQYHPEFDGYKIGTKVKQADVILLGYPLQWEMPEAVLRNDLSMYAKVTNVSGPAMTGSMFAIGWLQLGELTKAAEVFNKNFNYIKNEFQVWHEVTVGKGATNFITGMGGFLQSVIFGYGGIRIQQDHLLLNPNLPPDTTELSFTGLDYQGSSFDYIIQDTEAMLILTAQRSGAPPLTLYLEDPEDIQLLTLNRVIRFARRKAIIKIGAPAANGAEAG